VYGLLKKYFFCHPGWFGIRITDQLEYKIWNISPWFRVCASLCPEWQRRRIERSTTIIHVGSPCWKRASNNRSEKLL